MALTTFLESNTQDYLRESLPQHQDFPALLRYPHCREYAHATCRTCPQVGKPCHKSYEHGKLTGEVPPAVRTSLSRLREMQYLISRLDADAAAPLGSQPGYVINDTGPSLNSVDYVGWIIVSASGSTLVLTTPDDSDVGARGMFPGRIPNESGLGYSSSTGFTTVQPNDLLTFDGPSVLAGKTWCRVSRVSFDRTANTVSVELDHDVSNATTDSRGPVDPAVVYSCRTWRSASLDGWTPIVPASQMQCRWRTITLHRSTLPADGRIELTRPDGTNCRIAWPEGASVINGCDRAATFVALKRTNGPEPVDLSTDCFSRVFMEPVGSGTDGKGDYRTTLCLGSTDLEGNETFSSLITDDFQSISISYLYEVGDSVKNNIRNIVPCGRRCVHSKRDFSGSTWDADDGVAELENETWYCELRRYSVMEPKPGLLGEYQQVWHKPSGIDSYTADCSLYGTCDNFAPIDQAAEGARPFTDWNTSARVYREMWCSVPWKQVQGFPGDSSYRNYSNTHIGTPSLLSLHGGPSLQNPVGWHSTVTFPRYGMGYVYDYATKTDDNGNTQLDCPSGYVYDIRSDWSTITFGNRSTYPEPGFVATVSTEPKRDALNDTWTADTDWSGETALWPDRGSWRLRRDEGTHCGRGFAQWTNCVNGNEQLILAGIEPTRTGEIQDCTDGTVEILETPQTGPNGFPYGATVQIRKLTGNAKDPVGDVVSGVVAALSVSGGVATIDLENTEQRWSYLRTLGAGNSWDEIVTWYGGGMFCQPPAWAKVRSIYHPDSSIGGLLDRCAPADCVRFETTTSGDPHFNQRLFMVTRTQAFGPNQAPDWGPAKRTLQFEPLGGYYSPAANLDLGTGLFASVSESSATLDRDRTADVNALYWTTEPPFPNGSHIRCDRTGEVALITLVEPDSKRVWVSRGQLGTTAQALTAGDSWTLQMVFNTTTGALMTRVEQRTRPVLTAGQYWVDEQRNRIYWSDSNHGQTVEVSYYASGHSDVRSAYAYRETGHVIGRTIRGETEDPWEWPYLATEMADSEFDGAGGTSIKMEGTTLSQGSGSPTATTYLRTTDDSGKVLLFFSIGNAGRVGNITITQSGTLNPPGEVADAPGYSDPGWGRNRDRIWVRDHNNWIATNAAALVGTTITATRGQGVLDPRSGVVLKWTVLGQDAYTTLSEGTDYMVSYGEGIIWLTPATVSAMAEHGRVCLLLI